MINDGITKFVIGVDASKDMIDLSIQKNKENDQRYQYLVKDVYTLLPDDVGGTIPLIISIYLLQYTKTVDELFLMLSAIRRVCGKFFIGLVPNSSLIDNAKKMKKYGMDICFHKDIKDGDSLSIISDFDEPSSFTVTNFWYSLETYKNIFRKVGFCTCKWVKQHINPQATEEQKIFFADYTSIGMSFIAVI
ncbi:unnamed protein product [Adineta steineri]|uniref:Uncharacterized protein n=1 Tax=Adineta steineri TaxID=433720 RepID=A0A814KDD2_9BILA|nr:unnamed protein product [Adineta steineri]CAF1205635.1 unnamed protein product [Adineta steineri]CAF4079292.1 unnamed protein product [Adineta steineri]